MDATHEVYDCILCGVFFTGTWLWLSFVVAICLYAVLKDRQQTKRELKDAETFQQQIDEIKHKDYGKD